LHELKRIISKNSFGQNSQQTEQLKTVEAITHRQQKRSIVPVPINWRRCPKLPALLADTAHFYRQALPGLLVKLPNSRQEKAPSKWG